MSSGRKHRPALFIGVAFVALVGVVIAIRLPQPPDPSPTTRGSSDANPPDSEKETPSGTVVPADRPAGAPPDLGALLKEHQDAPEKLLEKARAARSDQEFRAALLAFALLRDPGPELLAFVESSEVSENNRIFALACYGLDRTSFERDAPEARRAIEFGDLSEGWPKRIIKDPDACRRLWKTGLGEGKVLNLFGEILDYTTEKTESGKGRKIPADLGHAILELAPRAQGTDAQGRALAGLVALAVGEIDEGTRLRYDQFLDRALSGDASVKDYLYALLQPMARANDTAALMGLYARASSAESARTLATAIHQSVKPNMSASTVSGLAEAAETSRDSEARDYLIEALVRAGGDKALAPLTRIYDRHKADPIAAAAALAAVSKINAPFPERDRWLVTRAHTSLTQLAGSPPSQEGLLAAGRLADILAASGGEEQIVALEGIASSIPPAQSELRKIVTEARNTLKQRLGKTPR